MFSTYNDLTDHILLNINDYIGPWLSTQLVHDIYLKRKEGNLPMINCEKLSCKSLCIIFIFH
jgi:hypothetical protein